MMITEAVELKNRFLEALQRRYQETREGIHVSDLVYCLRQAYYRKVDPKPPTIRQLAFFVDGARRHAALQALCGSQVEVQVERWGIRGTIDALNGDGPIEFKSTRAREATPDHYWTQLEYYMALTNARRGYLIIQRLNARRDEDPWEFYLIERTPEELAQIGQEMRSKAQALRRALETRDPSRLPWPSRDMRWKCRNCPYRQRCRA